ncbi:MAG: hypothetical protein A2Y02_02330 [Omnitrophica bacterium GWA2_52_12]|nr:MAG: hypothetical protein A2Y02_02330 [Omnitrophica bacterium GWA2_52_12]
MMSKTLEKEDLLFHVTHGLCRVSAVMAATTAASNEGSYALVPVSLNHGKVRFIIPQSSLENSGFSRLISVKQALAILEYFKTGNKKETEFGHAWTLAETIRSESCSKEPQKDKRKRQKLEHSVKGITGELAFVLNQSVGDMVGKIQKSLASSSPVNPLVLTVLANANTD